MLVIIVNTLCILPATALQFYYQSRAAAMKHPRVYVAAATAVSATIWFVNNFLCSPPSAALDTLQLFQCYVLAWLFARRGEKLKAMVTALVYMCVSILGNYLLALAAFPVGERLGLTAAQMMDTRGTSVTVMELLSFLELLLIFPLIDRLLHWLWNAPKSLRYLLLFAPVPLSQAVSLNLIDRYLPQPGTTVGFSLPLCIALICSLAADVCAVVSIRKLQNAAQTEAQLKTAEQQLNVQTDYYRQLQENILSVNQIRHDLNNQLTTAYRLLDEGQNEEVRRQLDVLRTSIREKVGARYCGNLIVDAVLDEKARRCREENIRLSLDAELPPQLPIESAHLCSAFSNLLDNGIQGALESGAVEKIIELRATVQKDCLVIRCQNTAAPPEKKDRSDPLRPHGLGLGILSRLAEQYDGNFRVEYSDGEYTATLILRFPQKQMKEGFLCF